MAYGEPMFETLRFTVGQPEVDMISVIERPVPDAPVVSEVPFADTPRFTGDRGAISTRVGILVGVGTLAAASLGIFGANRYVFNDSDNSGSTPAGASAGKDIDCKNGKFVDVSTHGSLYGSEAFLPKVNKIASEKDAKSVVRGLFDKDGPLGGAKIDKSSLAAVMAAIVKPSHDGEAVNPNYDYVQVYKEKMAAYEADDGLTTAKQDCVQAADTLVQTGHYVEKWAEEKETVTLLKADRDVDNLDADHKNEIVGLTPTKHVTPSALGGVVFRVGENNTNKDIDGFTEVLLTKEGKLYVKGVTVGESGGATDSDTEGESAKGKAKAGGGKAGNQGGGQTQGGAPGGNGPGCDGIGTDCEGAGPGGPGGPGGDDDNETTPTTRTTPTSAPPATTPTTRPPTTTSTTRPSPTTTEKPKGSTPTTVKEECNEHNPC